MRLLIATLNQHKQQEYQQLLANLNWELVFPQDIGLGDLDVAESGDSMAANALLKAEAFAHQAQLPTLADDYGLEVVALGGAPGTKAKRFHPGSDRDRNLKILELLQDKPDRSAQTVCAVAFVTPNGETHTEQAEYPGSIATHIKGDQGFGYDVIFIPQGETQTIAQLGQEYKNQHSHRALAIRQMETWLKSQKAN